MERLTKPGLTRLALAAVWLTAAMITYIGPAQAQTAKIVARFAPEEGIIVDAALIGTDHIALLYPDAGRIADYSIDGVLHQHIWREGGEERRFRPTACVTDPRGNLLVFDEADRKLFFIRPDGNISRGINLAYPGGANGSLIALSRIGDLAYGTGDVIWTLLTERGILAGFDTDGSHVVNLELGNLLPYPNAVYSRAQLLGDGSMFVLDYAQGAVIYRRGVAESFKRLRIDAPEGLDGAPVLQDFAVDPSGNVLMVSGDGDAMLKFLTPGENGYNAHTINLNLPGTGHRLACRWSGGKYIVWLRNQPLVLVVEVVE